MGWRFPSSSFARAGEDWSAVELVERAGHLRPLLGDSGGVTFGGGEPTLQAQELEKNRQSYQELATSIIELAERAGFEPAEQFGNHSHAFQACSIGLSDTSPSRDYIYRNFAFCQF